MNKLTLLAVALASLPCFWGIATADQVPPPVAGQPDPAAVPRELNEREQEYLAALQKCEPLRESERQACIKAVKDRYGLM